MLHISSPIDSKTCPQKSFKKPFPSPSPSRNQEHSECPHGGLWGNLWEHSDKTPANFQQPCPKTFFFKKKKKYGVLCNLAMHNSSNFLNVLVHLKLLQWLAQPFKGQSHPFQTSLPVSYCCLYGSLLKFLSYLSGAWLMERKAQELGIMAWIASFSKCKPCWVKNLPFTQLTSAFPEVGTHDTPPHCLQQFAHVKRASTSNVLPTPHSPSEEKIAKCWVRLACLAEQVFFFFSLSDLCLSIH